MANGNEGRGDCHRRFSNHRSADDSGTLCRKASATTPVITVLAILLGKQICVLFGADTATTEYVATSLPQFAIGFIITAINVMISAYLYSTERSGLSTSISILRSLIINSAVILILPHMFDNGAIWFSLLVYEAIVLVIATILLSRSERNGIQFKQRGKSMIITISREFGSQRSIDLTPTMWPVFQRAMCGRRIR